MNMRKDHKERILKIIKTMYEAHGAISNFINNNKFELCMNLVVDCQNAVTHIKSAVEPFASENGNVIKQVESYQKVLNQIISNDVAKLNGNTVKLNLDKRLRALKNAIQNDIKVKLHIVFFPYKASMWTSFESIWKAAVNDSRCEVSVVVIPYCEFDKHLKVQKWVYEGSLFPNYVDVVGYDRYKLDLMKPDIAFIHNGYDEGNTLTNVFSYFYSENIKKYSGCLVYSPYFTFGSYTKGVSDGFYVNQGSINADKIVVQSLFVADIYKKYGYKPSKLLVYGSPKIDSIVMNCSDNSSSSKEKDMPNEWREKLLGKEKIFLLSTHWAYFLKGHQYEEKGFFDFAVKYHEMFYETALKNKNRCGIIWRPHPLMIPAIEQRCPKLLHYIRDFTCRLEKSDFAVVDRNASYINSFNCSDALISTYSSIIHEYMATGKPIQIFQSKPTDEGGSRSPIDYRTCYFFFRKDNGMSFNQFMQMVLDGQDPKKDERMNMFRSKAFINTDGTAGKKILDKLISEIL